ncbi:hypothetical protein [Clostridium beijerinckii]|uniref:hypothetical protein n=1 Tax=Clostridium beijerinckii TaxID=1520 RepID=UPI00098CA9DA|nr:hypothetical protein [Clostridium beijerinckii]NRU38911.1 hypothetical protein [Clostridium beijerinckii]NSA97810.1 hypothetical protein [Clostridium beijerinckii]OOM68654.1 hypothetical protein CLOBI_02090 [Clostridium beijerinckii]OOM72637.1 hypothetical protein CLBEIC_06460 [Clostridium beijerinckii]CUU48442.1 conserved membrane protein of unknown function [Clostridium beijerinckii]
MFRNIVLTKAGDSTLAIAFVIGSLNFNKEFSSEAIMTFLSIILSAILVIIHNLEFKPKKYLNIWVLEISTIFAIIYCFISIISSAYLYKTLSEAPLKRIGLFWNAFSFLVVICNIINIGVSYLGTKILKKSNDNQDRD